MTQSQLKSKIKELQDEIIRLDAKYHFSTDDVEVDEKTLDMISKKIDQLQMLQDMLKIEL
jgi:NAD-dependent DNA ligase